MPEIYVVDLPEEINAKDISALLNKEQLMQGFWISELPQISVGTPNGRVAIKRIAILDINSHPRTVWKLQNCLSNAYGDFDLAMQSTRYYINIEPSQGQPLPLFTPYLYKPGEGRGERLPHLTFRDTFTTNRELLKPDPYRFFLDIEALIAQYY